MNAYLLPTIEFGPRIIQRLLAHLQDDRMDVRLHLDRFTAREVIAHLADWEPIMRERIQMAVSQPGSAVAAHDEGQMAIDHRYAESDPHERLQILIRERAVTAALLHSLQPQDWTKSVHHPERGPQSVEDLANLLLGHDLYHIEQLTEYLSQR